ncbi:MAG: FkbM family methyltransferase, partial [Candidatus Omnitrophota bacterium]|nr:FkbM family methyltransferase [Candidatus Omnitrophota bacterium]
MKNIYFFLCSTWVIFKLERGLKNKLSLFFDFARIFFKYNFLVKPFKIKLRSEKISGYSVKFSDYRTFQSLFSDIFIHKEYDFVSDNDSPLIVDCGTNFGMSAIYFKIKYPRSRVICFEPHKETFKLLEENMVNNNFRGVELHDAALSDRGGTSRFYSDADKNNITGMSLTRRLEEKGMRLAEESVKTVLLSDFIDGPVDFLKMDIEGSETDVLGDIRAKSKLALVKKIVCEYHYSASGQTNRLGALLDIVEGSGFRYAIRANAELPFDFSGNKPFNLL